MGLVSLEETPGGAVAHLLREDTARSLGPGRGPPPTLLPP